MVTSIHVNQNFLPLKFILENAYATRDELITVPKVAILVITNELKKNLANEIPLNPFHPVT